MAVVFKIHPAIGIARVGNHLSSFFVGPELACASELKDAPLVTGAGPVELDQHGNDVPFTTYKRDGSIRRQGARFRVFAYDEAGDGTLKNPREVTSGAHIKLIWTVTLCNRKAAWDHRIAGAGRRNDTVNDREKLIVGPLTRTIEIANAASAEFVGQLFGSAAEGRPVTLGMLRTDAGGRLIVLGGFGKGYNDGTNKDLSGGSFGDRDGWVDDIADGPVDVEVLVDQEKKKVVGGARVIVAPPDFAPDIGQPVTLYDAVRQAAQSLGLTDPTEPSFSRDVLPLLARCAKLRWTHFDPLWGTLDQKINGNWAALSRTGGANKPLREEINQLLSGDLPLVYREHPREFVQLTPVQKAVLALWVKGTFKDDWDQPPLPKLNEPDDLDRGPLEHAVGAGFYPGIEAGDRMADSGNYSEPFRLKPELLAGFLSEQMAVPWHSDFYACAGEWWPSQRPDLAPQQDQSKPGWITGLVHDAKTMVENFPKLGYIKPAMVGGKYVQIEDERIPPRS